MKKTVALFLSLSVAVFGLPVSSFAAKSLIRINGLTRNEVLTYAGQGNEVARAGKDFIELVVEQNQIKKFAAAHPVSTLIPDLNKEIKKVLGTQRDGEKYFTYETMTQALQDFAKTYPNLCVLESIGKTVEGRDIWALKISDNPTQNEKEPATLVMGAHHAREWATFEVPMAAIKQLLESYGKDETLTRLVNEREAWFVPMVNPDGVTYSQKQYQYWRKNRSKNSNNSFGTDLNRNYGYKWGVSGASTSPGSDTYMGTKAFSELETQAIRDFVKRERICGSLSFHSYAEEILYPWSYASGVSCEHHPVLRKMADEMGKLNKYYVQESADMYPAAGETDDWMYGDNKSLSFTFEIGKTFIPAPADIAGLCAENVPCIFYHIDKAGTYGVVTPAGDALVEELSIRDSMTAIRDFSRLSGDARYADLVTRLQKSLSQKVLAEVTRGEHGSLQQLEAQKDCDALQSVVKIIRHCQAFEKLHSL